MPSANAARYQQIAQEMQQIVATAEQEKRGLSPEERGQFTALDDEFRALEPLVRVDSITEQMAAVPPPRVEPPSPSAGYTNGTPVPRSGRPSFSGGTPVAHNYSNHGFTNGLGEYLGSVYARAVSGTDDRRLMPVNAITTWTGEGIGADGGFALPPQFVQGIMSLVAPEDSFIRALNPIPTTSDILTIPVDEDAPWATTAVTAAKTAEGGAITASKIATKPVKVVMYGIKSLVHVDEKSLRDMSFLGSYVQRKMGEKIRWKMENYCINGTGEDEPLGILNAPGLVSLSDVNSTASTIGPEDFMAMKAAALAGPGGFWVCHPLVQPMIWSLKSGTGGFPLYTTDMKQSPDGSLLGAGVFVSEACKPLNTTGDIFYVKPGGYFLAIEAGGVQSATTISFAFDQNLQSFRSTLYMGGAPSLSAKVLRADGSNYASNLIALTGGRS
jgi:HK97 family phage major capsid protein